MTLLSTLLLFQDVSGGELVLVLLAVFMLFGPKKIPDIAKKLAKGLHDIKKATGDISEQVNQAIDPIRKELQDPIDSIKKDLNLDNKHEKKEKSGPDKKTDDTPAG
jgi:TatA/E family protein of Tat protein translocase